jgi:uncharacterized protein YdhG (YjbR/CyaY superfamily)
VLIASSSIAGMKKPRPTKHAASNRQGMKKRSSKQTSSKRATPKRRATKPKAASRTTRSPQTVDQYFAAVPDPARGALQQIRAAIHSVVPPDATEIISYKIPAFRHKKVLVWYAAFANHCSLFPTASVIEQFKDELKDFSTSKGTIHFPMDKPIPVELIKRLVRARVEQNENKKR